MKILYPLSEITPSYGGIGSNVYKIIKGLLNKYNDYEAVIVTSNQQQEDTFQKYFEDTERMKIISLFEHGFNKIFLRDLYFQIKIARKIKKIIKDEKIDVVHHQSGHLDLFFAINFIKDKPVIMTSHGDTYTLLKIWKNAKLRNINEKVNYFAGKLLYHEEKSLYKKSDKIIAVADHVKKSIIKNYEIKSEKINMIFNYVDPDIFDFHPGNVTKPYKIGFIGRPYFIKGFYDLIKLLNNTKLNNTFEWHLVTDTELVKKLVKNNKNIVYYKNIPQSRLTKFYDDMDFMFVPSYSEACNTVILESLMKGKICIARNIVGLQEILKDCKCYFFQDISNLDFNDIIKNISLDSEKLMQDLKGNRNKTIQRFGPTNAIKKTYEIYKEYMG